ncbi:poly [ADP-ribose] polymerase 1-like [Oscarella lobularis]|uniref:poly [ADP-ribose] polymerase 1-like n=1 Tax=Oscarella lobularis TaxID=121494 RepID=UPI00331361B2
MEDLPFKAEYAKSGRASCKSCHSGISKECLRLGKMVQSPHFDGKIPQWHHFHCFFRKIGGKCTSTAEIAGFGSLRWEDQQKIKTQIGGGGSQSGGVDSVDGGEAGDGDCPLQVEYAKSNRSECRSCGEKIVKGVVRIGRLEDADPSEHRGYAGTVTRWFHVDCFVEEDPNANASSFKRIGDLKKSDQDSLRATFKGGKSKGKGSKRKGAKSGGDGAKKMKAEELEEEKILKEQSDIIWKIRDALKKGASTGEMKLMMEANGQKIVNSGESALLAHVSDGMAFGALKRCPECKDGQLIIKGDAYHCTGNMTEWTKCSYTTLDPTRSKWIIPGELKDAVFLKGFAFKKRKRIFPKVTESALSPAQAPSTKKSKIEKPLEGMKVAIIGRLSKTKAVLTKEIESLGGSVTNSVNSRLAFCLSSEAEVDKGSGKIDAAESADVPIVSVDFLDDAAKGGALLKIPQYNLVSWGLNRKEETEVDGKSKLKLTVKGGGAVDPESGLEDSCHVYEEGKDAFTATLGLVDIARGTNSYYKLQLLESDRGHRYYVFRAWGRVGTNIGGNKLDHFVSRNEALDEFKFYYTDKTANSWEERKKFVKRPGKFYPLDIDYGEEDEMLSGVVPGSKSTLSKPIQEIIRMIFDIETMKRALVEFEIDLKKMPLGKLSRRQIEEAYSVLTEAQTVVSSDKNPSKILDCSNRFYTLIPHDFGMQKPPLLDNADFINAKTQMLDGLLDIEVAYSLLKSKSDDAGTRDPIDVNYEKLKTDMEVLDHKSDEFQMLVDYVANTHGVTHRGYTLEVQDILKIDRHGEGKRYKPFKKLPNRMLLWHGSRTSNFAGILSQGLRIAPPEAPVTGYMFGKGVYFADMVTKSANYCHTSSAAPVGLMLLCEVALGEMYERLHADHITKLPKGKHSTKGVGRMFPDPSGTRVMDDGMIIPMGKGRTEGDAGGSLQYNEYIVYDVAQIRMKYLFKMNFKHKW